MWSIYTCTKMSTEVNESRHVGKSNGHKIMTFELQSQNSYFTVNIKSHMDICFPLLACLKNDILNTAAVIWTRATAVMNASDESSYQEGGMLGNSSWSYSYYHQNYTLSTPLLPDKTSTSKPAACEQLHIAVEVWTVCVILNTKLRCCTFLTVALALLVSTGSHLFC